MSSDGKVVIKIDDNAREVAKSFENLSDKTARYEDILKEVAGTSNASFPVYDKLRKKLDEQYKAADKAVESFKKFSDVRLSGANFNQLFSVTGNAVERLKTLAIQGRTNSSEFKKLSESVKLNTKNMQEAENVVKKAIGGVNELSASAKILNTVFGAFGLVNISNQIYNLGQNAIQTAGQFEQLETSFKIMAGGAEQGQALTKSLVELASKTPMTTKGLARATQTLLSFGESSDNVIKDLKLLGDISGGEEQRFQSLALAFAQVGSTGRLTGQDLLQMVNQGFNPLQVISEKTGKSMATLKKEMGDGKISFDMVKQAMVDATSAGGRFYGLMEEQSRTLNGLMSTLEDTWEQTANELGQMLLPAAKNTASQLIRMGEAAQGGVKWFREEQHNLGLLTKSLVAGTTAFVTFNAAAGVSMTTALTTSTAALSRAKNAVLALTAACKANPYFLAASGIAVSITGITAALGNNQRELQNTTDKLKELAQQVSTNASETPKLIAEYRNLATQTNRTGEQEQRFIELQDTINKQYPGLLEKYGKDIEKQGELKDSVAKTIEEYIRLAEVQKLVAQQKAIEEKYNKAVANRWYWNENSYPAVKNRIKAMEEYNAAIEPVTAALQKLNRLRTANANVISGKNTTKNNGFGSGGSGNVTSASAEKIKDAFEKAQEEAQKAEKAFKLALYQSGGNITPAVEKARLKMVDTKKAVEDVQKAYERITATAKTPFEQLNYNIEQSRQKIISLASQPIVNIEAIRQAQAEYQGFLAQQEQINAYLQPAKGHLEELNLKIQETQRLLGELYFTKGVNSEEFIKAKNELVQLQTTAKNVNTAITSQVGVDWANISESIKSNLSSAILTPLQEGESAFDRLAKIGLNAVQLVGQEIIKNLMEQITLEKTLAAIKTAGKAIGSFFGFGFKDGAAFNNGNVIPFARGGVVNQPTLFPMANGGTGLMGEAGAEAVMPLRRMSNGRLGVEAENENGKAVNVNIYNQSGANVETRKRDDGSMDIFIRKVNEALSSERTSSGFRSAYAREDRKGVQAV